ncbi:hypothetical protein [Aquimarina agarivorans]|uniref:hypothetical protein n=1 Tax=Aquimarina agarivorans TaxID=980584 RepID=UPI000248E865|nr:hypothetical protein [Aquimarina agarivorans]
MKRKLLLILFLGASLMANSQNVSVENSQFGVQAIIISIYAQYEKKLTNLVTLRGEIGLEPGITAESDVDSRRLFLSPVLNLESRWYYNLNKRLKKSKRIDLNSGNFVSLRTSYHPGWFAISRSNIPINVISDIVINPYWGIRRNLGKKFNYEVGAGVAFVSRLEEFSSRSIKNNFFIADLHLRIGYTF